MPESALFKSKNGEIKYNESYEATLRQWPVAYETMYIETEFGKTHIITAGQKNSESLILLHCQGFSSTMWLYNISELSRHYRVYAIDTLGEPGRSIPNRKKFSSSDYAEWLKEVINKLSIEDAGFIGYSYGGWLALNFALSFPDKVSKLVLIDPAAAITPIKPQFIFRVLAALILPASFIIKSFIKWLSGSSTVLDEKIFKQFSLGMRYFKWPKGFPLTVFTDTELENLKNPLLLLMGEKDPIYKNGVEFVKTRIEKLLPDVSVGIIPDAGHGLPIEKPEVVNNLIETFLEKLWSPNRG